MWLCPFGKGSTVWCMQSNSMDVTFFEVRKDGTSVCIPRKTPQLLYTVGPPILGPYNPSARLEFSIPISF
jgi:hypothetical protein